MRLLPLPTFLLAAYIIIFLTFSSCSDDSTSSETPTVEITNASHSFTQINDCDIGGTPATRFLFELIYNASSDIEIDGVEFDNMFSSGTESDNNFENNFEINDNSLTFDWCYRFGGSDWVELTIKILAEDEEVESNEYTIRVDRPNGANKSSQ